MSGANLGVVEGAMRSIEKVHTYIGHGMDDVIDVSLDLAEAESDSNQLAELQQVMLDYAKMEQDLRVFTQAVDNVKTQIRHADPNDVPDMEKLLDAQLKDLEKQNSDDPEILQRHEKVKELKEKLWECQNPGENMPSEATEQTLGEDEDFVMTQAEIVTKCPITQQEMKDPVKNKLCSHNYEREAITAMLKNRRSMKCPVSGCSNNRHVQNKDLEDNKDLKKYIERKNRMAAKNKRPKKGSK
ncbi:E3 SUMO-protein ligase NSE2-like [Amphiura filiformis]|uniref:E3 SUMO-protein ligase NSE2-like n=1 Tax=Amphiura filiformis TaxID=82378 RepID=UPI003B228A0F